MPQEISHFEGTFHGFKSSFNLENEVNVSKLLSELKFVPVIDPCMFGENPSTGSTELLHIRLCP